MKNFNFHQTTEIKFGIGRVQELGQIVAQYGTKVLLVTTPAAVPALAQQYKKVIQILEASEILVAHFDGVIPNPTVETISKGAKMAREFGAEVIIGLGGGSSMDSAKAISVEATHPGTSWDYLFYKTPQPDAKKLLPVIAISTTSGTGSQVTQVAVVTNPEVRDKSALYNNILYPQVTIIDPELMISVPKFVTATTGFDVLCHAFESTINPGTGAYVNLLAWEAISLVVENLSALLVNLDDINCRENMAWADTLGGLCIANAGVTLPHGMGMAIGGMYPNVAHGESLAIVYPAFIKFTWKWAVPQFSKLARILNPELKKITDEQAAEKSVEEMDKFLKKIGLWISLKDKGMPENEINLLARQCMVLPDYKGNPRVATEDEMIELVKQSFFK
ncbi:iron-containing alcohol dehydrogenase [Microbacter margulisiae]|uniref:Alcohol dehydrogenase class IV n=1 Tax=Microbacter margulisiae TaxID=1350067 RepID=A0A7W5DNV2_9PORP|nr:iron-containing alcohol dehydrogenase [Microbacter margulisiae]MBB3186211.1 alcohol dehydrogenase class IV [Microbacter margulisiae]